MNLQELIIELLKEGVLINEVKLKQIDNLTCLSYRIDGFYKSGGVDLYETSDGIFAEARYNEINQIESIDDLISLNYTWWQRSKERYDGWTNPDSKWINLLLRKGLVTEKVKTVKTYQ